MRYILHIAFIIFISLFTTACSDKDTNKKLKIVMLSDISSIDDKSFNANIWNGVLQYAKEHDLPKENYIFSVSSTKDDIIDNLSNFADKHPDIIITSGALFKEPLDKVAPRYPKKRFLGFDIWNDNIPNIASTTFLAGEASYLAGICAALKAKELNTTKVGFLGGMDFYVIRNFLIGYEAGVKAVDKNMEVMVQFAGDFANPTKGQQIASAMYNQGIKIIFNVAGSTGNGLIKEAKHRAVRGEDVWVIGVDRDQYEDGIYDKNKSVILTSVLKNLNIVTYNILTEVQNGTFKGGIRTYSLKNNGVGLPKNNPNLKPEWMKIVNKHKADIIAGKIKIKVLTK